MQYPILRDEAPIPSDVPVDGAHNDDLTLMIVNYQAPFAVAAIAALIACGTADPARDDGQATSVSIADSAGVRIVRHRALDDDPADHWIIDGAPQLVIGGTSDPLGVIASVDIDPAGRLVVADRTAVEIRLYENGVAIARLQPDIETIWRLRAGDDSLYYILDEASGRLAVLGPDGRVRSSVALPPDLTNVPVSATPQPGNIDLLGVLAGGETVIVGRAYADNAVDGWTWSVVPVFGVSTTGEGRMITTAPQMELLRMAGAPTFVRPHFRAVAEATVSRGHVVVSNGKDYAIDVLRPDGRVTMKVRGDIAPVPVTAEHLEAYEAWLFEQLGDAPAATLEDYRRAFAATPAAATLPAIRHIMADTEGCVWVERHPDPRTWVAGADTVPHRWDIFDRDGSRVGWTLVPAGLRARTADRNTLVVTAEAGGRRVQVHGIRRTAACLPTAGEGAAPGPES